jgi:cullin-4
MLNNDVPDISTSKNYFKDITLSQELNEILHQKHPDMRGLSVMVLQQGYWPFATPTQTVLLPTEMENALQTYRAFYKNEKTIHNNRKLLWHYALCTATLTARFKKATKEFSVSLFQALILLLFNDESKTSWSLAEIRESTGLEEEELKRTLQSLACGKKRVLKKTPAGRDVLEEDEFQVNADFQDPRARVHINSIQVKETVRPLHLVIHLFLIHSRPKNTSVRRLRSRKIGSITWMLLSFVS